jgi:hypothetical protein
VSAVVWFEAAIKRQCERGCGCAIEPGDKTAYLPDDDYAVVCLACGEQTEKEHP